MLNILGKLRDLKVVVKEWDGRKRSQMKKYLKDISDELDILCPQLLQHNPLASLRASIHSVERKRKHILQVREATWHLKSRAIWIWEGDRNTKFFHRFSNHRRKVNSIWEIIDTEGNRIQSQQDISKAVLQHFEKAYRRRGKDYAEAQIWGVDVYPNMFDDDANTTLYKRGHYGGNFLSAQIF